MNWEAIALVAGPVAFLVLASRAVLHRGLSAGHAARLAMIWVGIILALWAVVSAIDTIIYHGFT